MKLTREEKWIVLGVPVIFILGAIAHFAFNLLNENNIAGLFFPTNESPWEHLKMVIIPTVLWWISDCIITCKKQKGGTGKWLTASVISIITAMVTILLLFYFYNGAFGIENLVIDIIIFFSAVVIGQLSGLWFNRKSMSVPVFLPILLMIFIIAAFAYFTIYPPNLPLFRDFGK